MPVGPEATQMVTNVQTFYNEIDKRVSDPEWISNWRCGPDKEGLYWWSVPVVAPEPNMATREVILGAYLRAGWDKVEIKTSSENGERPGCTSIILYKAA